MKKIVAKFGALLMALLVLFSSTSFLKSTHYCADQISDVSYFVVSENCGAELEASCEVAIKDSSVEKRSCCSTDSEIIKAQNFSKENNSLQETLAFLDYSIVSNDFLQISNKIFVPATANNFGYRQPFVLKKINILYETFLI